MSGHDEPLEPGHWASAKVYLSVDEDRKALTVIHRGEADDGDNAVLHSTFWLDVSDLAQVYEVVESLLLVTFREAWSQVADPF